MDQILADETVDDGGTEDVLWTLTDHLNTVRDLASYNPGTDQTTIANRRVYDAFGNLESETNAAVDCVFSYTGRLFDEDSGLQNNLHRWYDAEIGRWLSEDPIGFEGGDANLYRYVANDLINNADPTGMLTSSEIVISIFNPSKASKVDTARGEAVTLSQELAKDLGCQGTVHNGPQDAMRHAIWNARMTQYIGPDEARKFADAHEAEWGFGRDTYGST